MKRRTLVAGTVAGSVTAALTITDLSSTAADRSVQAPASSTIKPAMLKPGDRVGMVAPASNVYEAEDVRIAKETMEQYGFEVILGKHLQDQYGYLAGQDRDRTQGLTKPILYNLIFGHLRENAVIPVGAIATLDDGRKTLVLNESAVI
jgi:muramoyltetrapeptide carboxypeptidase